MDTCPTVIQMSPQPINILHRIFNRPAHIAMTRYCNLYILKSGMLGSHRLVAITEVRRIATELHDGCFCTMHCMGPLYY